MSKILIFGNRGSGKSTLAKKLVKVEGVAHLDLDSLAWLPETLPQRAP
ncbi:MAG: shikimate kinase, partial [Gammaproteobacteria bacterium]